MQLPERVKEAFAGCRDRVGIAPLGLIMLVRFVVLGVFVRVEVVPHIQQRRSARLGNRSTAPYPTRERRISRPRPSADLPCAAMSSWPVHTLEEVRRVDPVIAEVL